MPGGPPGPGFAALRQTPNDQMAQLLVQAQTLGDLGQSMVALRAAYAASDAEEAQQVADLRSHPWAIEVAVDSVPGAPLAASDLAANPTSPAPTPAAAPVTWAVEIAIGNP
jgi:hypothetical protein